MAQDENAAKQPGRREGFAGLAARVSDVDAILQRTRAPATAAPNAPASVSDQPDRPAAGGRGTNLPALAAPGTSRPAAAGGTETASVLATGPARQAPGREPAGLGRMVRYGLPMLAALVFAFWLGSQTSRPNAPAMPASEHLAQAAPAVAQGRISGVESADTPTNIPPAATAGARATTPAAGREDARLEQPAVSESPPDSSATGPGAAVAVHAAELDGAEQGQPVAAAPSLADAPTEPTRQTRDMPGNPTIGVASATTVPGTPAALDPSRTGADSTSADPAAAAQATLTTGTDTSEQPDNTAQHSPAASLPAATRAPAPGAAPVTHAGDNPTLATEPATGTAEAAQMAPPAGSESHAHADGTLRNPADPTSASRRRSARATPAPSPATILAGTSAFERDSIEKACADARAQRDPSNYTSCLRWQMAALARSPGRPDLSRATPAEALVIERACAAERGSAGPGAYYSCVHREIRSLGVEQG